MLTQTVSGGETLPEDKLLLSQYGLDTAEFRIQNSEFRIQNPESRIQNSEVKQGLYLTLGRIVV
ncbi:hypothetical protein [Nostoc sp.]|uniref:hypothetical protein n=1 Tax=Nostoc sp. TaxID=1180 RepID=UPI002FFA6B5B